MTLVKRWTKTNTKSCGGGNVRGSGARNRPMQNQDKRRWRATTNASRKREGVPTGAGGATAQGGATRPSAGGRGGAGVRPERTAQVEQQQSRKIDGGLLKMRKNNQSVGKPMSKGSSTNSIKSCNCCNKQTSTGQTVTTKPNAQGGIQQLLRFSS